MCYEWYVVTFCKILYIIFTIFEKTIVVNAKLYCLTNSHDPFIAGWIWRQQVRVLAEHERGHKQRGKPQRAERSQLGAPAG